MRVVPFVLTAGGVALAAACGSSDDNALVGEGSRPGGKPPASGGSPATGGVSTGGASGISGTGGSAFITTGGTAGSGASPTSSGCTSDNDCTDFGLLCNVIVGRCVECILDADCKEGSVCRNEGCEEVLPCGNSIDCTTAPDRRTICDSVRLECVQCERVNDCAAGETCAASQCVAQAADHCLDGLQNDDELGIDCGGTTCAPCPPISTGGAYEVCTADTQCVDGRFCSISLTSGFFPGRPGSCVRPCTNNAAVCDPAPPGSAPPFCPSFGGAGVCALPCNADGSCAIGFECVPVALGVAFCMPPVPPPQP